MSIREISEEFLGDPLLLERIFISALIILISIIMYRFLKKGLEIFQKRSACPDTITKLFRILIKYSVIAIAIFLVLDQFGVTANTLFTSFFAAIAMVAIGFVAVWSVLSNFFSTFILKAFKPFNIGDEIELHADGVKGKVTSIGVYFTTLVDMEDFSTFQIPNNIFFQKIIKRKKT